MRYGIVIPIVHCIHLVYKHHKALVYHFCNVVLGALFYTVSFGFEYWREHVHTIFVLKEYHNSLGYCRI